MGLFVRINSMTSFDIAEWNASAFSNDTKLDLLTDDFSTVSNTFRSIELLEIINDESVVSEYTAFNSFDSITFLGSRYVDRIKDFAPVIRVSLIKTDIVEQVNRLDKKVNNIVDVDSLSLDEYKNYILKNISDACQKDIYDGLVVELSDGTREYFSYDTQDQQDLKALFDTARQFPTFEFSWHSNNNLCKLYPAVDIIIIYATLQLKLLRATTYCNALNQIILNTEDRDTLSTYHYGYELPPESQQNVNRIIDAMSRVFNAILEPILPHNNTENDEDETNSDNENNNENE